MADCCIASFDVDEEALDQNLKQDLGGGLVIYKSGQRGILFKVVMGNAEDVPEVAVIQYYKNAQLADGQGHTVTIPPGPRDQRWKWSAGADGFIVDRASGDQRCWPEYNAQNA